MPNVLVVEDNLDSAQLFQRVLTARGFEVRHAPDAETALQLALESRPDLILLDLGLPDADGQTLAGWLRRLPSLSHIPIVACTAWPEETARQMVSAYGCNGYIRKPINVARFADQIAAFLPEGQKE
jgi:two-component system cell cycle response regulator DivK